MKTACTTLTMAILAGFVALGIPGVAVADTGAVVIAPATTLPGGTHFKSGEPVEADGFYQLQEDMAPNGISSGSSTGCPYDEEAIGQPLIG
ncbi:MAG: hypothetical protein GY927_11830 [bacterium]|nr:hypothetical protein [bacterium]